MSVSGHAPGASGALVRVNAQQPQSAALAQQVCIDQMTLADVDVRPTDNSYRPARLRSCARGVRLPERFSRREFLLLLLYRVTVILAINDMPSHNLSISNSVCLYRCRSTRRRCCRRSPTPTARCRSSRWTRTTPSSRCPTGPLLKWSVSFAFLPTTQPTVVENSVTHWGTFPNRNFMRRNYLQHKVELEVVNSFLFY